MDRKCLALVVSMALSPCICSGNPVQTPLERYDYEKLSGYSEMVEYLRELDGGSHLLNVSTIGRSVQGREIPALYFSSDETFGSKRSSKVMVFIYCQQHGNEPSGKEAALILARDLVEQKKSYLEEMDVILVPQVNPDGAEMGQRRNANGLDLNRNHVILSEPETLALHRLFLKWRPEVTLDVHEFNALGKDWISHGFIKDAEEMLDGVTNLNVAPPLIEFSTGVFIPEVGQAVREAGFTFHRYIVGSPFENRRIRHSTTAVNDGRQSMGIYNTLSFIVEGKRYGDLTNKIERRTRGQVTALTAFLGAMARHRSEILNVVRPAREELLRHSNSTRFSYIQMDYFPDPAREKLKYPVFDLFQWRHVQRELKNYQPLVKIKKSVERPYGYLFSPRQESLIDLLSKHQIQVSRLRTDSLLEIEAYTILHVTPCVDEDKACENVDVRITREERTLSKGALIVSLRQPAGNLLPLLLEPQSNWSVATERSGGKYRFAELLAEGEEYPILRVMGSKELDLEELQTHRGEVHLGLAQE